eukprot:GHVL01005492.1.p1 GENE.GHVL01005492.1~~GHVL01005492.1.p1  ORF type:complete len:537 (+),score=73.31 GHVL01005492.1:26-1636(+)
MILQYIILLFVVCTDAALNGVLQIPKWTIFSDEPNSNHSFKNLVNSSEEIKKFEAYHKLLKIGEEFVRLSKRESEITNKNKGAEVGIVYSTGLGISGLREVITGADYIKSELLAWPSKQDISVELYKSTRKRCDKLRMFLNCTVFNNTEFSSMTTETFDSEFLEWFSKSDSKHKNLMDHAVECEEGLMTDFLAITYLRDHEPGMDVIDWSLAFQGATFSMVEAIIALENILALVRQQSTIDGVVKNTFLMAELDGEWEPLIDLPFGPLVEERKLRSLGKSERTDKIETILKLYTDRLKIYINVTPDEQVIQRLNAWKKLSSTHPEKADFFKKILENIKKFKSAATREENIQFNILPVLEKIEEIMTKAQQAKDSEWIGPFLTNLNTTTIATLKLTAAIRSYGPQFYLGEHWEILFVSMMQFLTSLRVYSMHATPNMDKMVEEYLPQGGKTQQARNKLKWKTQLSRELKNCGVYTRNGVTLFNDVKREPQDILKTRILGRRVKLSNFIFLYIFNFYLNLYFFYIFNFYSNFILFFYS